MPPATTTSAMPSWICCAPSTIAFMPDEHTLFTVVQITESGSSAALAACRAGACPMPADSALPIQHCSTTDAGTPACGAACGWRWIGQAWWLEYQVRLTRFKQPVIAVAPSLAAGTDASEPPKPPMGVRAAATMHTSRGDVVERLLHARRDAPVRPARTRPDTNIDDARGVGTKLYRARVSQVIV
eukprot:scaffold94867_cov63-Phaeocystis_antarctica.AAC.2